MPQSQGPFRQSDAEVAAFWNEKIAALGRATEVDDGGQDTLLKMWRDRVQKSGPKIAMECLGRSHTFQEIDHMSDAVAAYLLERPYLAEGARIGIMLPNLSQYLVILMGVLKAGMVVVNCNPLYTKTELEHQLNDAGVQLLFTLPNVAKTSAEARVPSLKEVVLTGVGDMLPAPKRLLLSFVIRYVKRMIPPFQYLEGVSVTQFRSLLQVPRVELLTRLRRIENELSPSALAFLQYTGGTTGLSKGAMLTHGNIVINIFQSMASLGQDLRHKPIEALSWPGAKNVMALHPLPFYHIYGLTCCLFTTTVAGGAGALTLPNPREIGKLIKLLHRQDVMLLTAINTLLKAMLAHPDLGKSKLAPGLMVVEGGMATSPDVSRDWAEKTGIHITEGYGLTEASPLLTVVDPSHPKSGCAGYPVPLTLIKLRGDDGEDLPLGAGDGVRGELLAKGPQIMQGYYKLEAENRHIFSDDGYLQTGDIATVAKDGMIHIVDRKKDMILVSGFNVYPSEIESRVMDTGLVLECAAIGQPDARSGERVVLYAVPLDPKLDVKQLAERLAETLTNYKRPSEIRFVQTLPKSAVGKILRREVRKIADEQAKAS